MILSSSSPEVINYCGRTSSRSRQRSYKGYKKRSKSA
jgi:hypothetical protein